jgi:tetratricopeptide (TPR) repeat protein
MRREARRGQSMRLKAGIWLAAAWIAFAAATCFAGPQEDYKAAVEAIGNNDVAGAARYFKRVVDAKDAPAAVLAQSWFSLGAIAHSKGDFKDALDDYSRAIEINPNFAVAYGNRGNANFYLGNKDAALADFNTQIKLAPTAYQAYASRGYFYLTEGAFDKALDDFSRSLAINSNSAEVYCNRGIAYFSLGDTEKALADFDRAIALNPNLALAYRNRGELLLKMGEKDKAQADLDKAASLDPRLANVKK